MAFPALLNIDDVPDFLVGSMEVLYSRRLIAMFGFAIGALYGYLPSPLAFWHSVLPSASPLRPLVSVAFATISTLILYSTAFGLANVLTSERSSLRGITADFVIGRLALFASFALIGGLVTQTLPLTLSAAPIFDRFPDIARHHDRSSVCDGGKQRGSGSCWGAS